MSVSFWQRAASVEAPPYDVAIVGGGIVGCATAYWLRRRRAQLRVAIVEARSLAHGASGRNAGFVLQGTDRDYLSDVARYGARRAARLWRFTRESRDLLEAELRGAAFDFQACGNLVVAGDAAEAERLEAAVAPLRSIGAPVAYLTPSATNRRLQARGLGGSLYLTSGAMLNPLKLVRHIAAASGAHVYEHQPVRTVQPTGAHYRVKTDGRAIEAGQVVLALGAYLPRLRPALAPYVRPVRAQMLATEPIEPHLRLPVYTHAGDFYIRQAPDGAVLLGGARHSHADAEVGYEDATTPAVQRELERYLHRHFPWAHSAAIVQRWSGTMGFSPDGLPVVGAVPDQPGIVWVTGCTGHGMSYGFRLGRLVAALTLGDARPDGHALFAASRFDDPPAQAGKASSAAAQSAS